MGMVVKAGMFDCLSRGMDWCGAFHTSFMQYYILYKMEVEEGIVFFLLISLPWLLQYMIFIVMIIHSTVHSQCPNIHSIYIYIPSFYPLLWKMTESETDPILSYTVHECVYCTVQAYKKKNWKRKKKGGKTKIIHNPSFMQKKTIKSSQSVRQWVVAVEE